MTKGRPMRADALAMALLCLAGCVQPASTPTRQRTEQCYFYGPFSPGDAVHVAGTEGEWVVEEQVGPAVRVRREVRAYPGRSDKWRTERDEFPLGPGGAYQIRTVGVR